MFFGVDTSQSGASVEKRLPQVKHLTLPSRRGSAGFGRVVVGCRAVVVGRTVVVGCCRMVVSSWGRRVVAISLKVTFV